MGSHPINLTIRFLLEIAALISIGIWAWHLSDNWSSYLFTVALPIFAAAIWGLFNVPGDPSRSGKAPVKIPGSIRLLIELGILGFAAWSLFDMYYPILALIFSATAIIHYIFSYDRILWLIKRK